MPDRVDTRRRPWRGPRRRRRRRAVTASTRPPEVTTCAVPVERGAGVQHVDARPRARPRPRPCDAVAGARRRAGSPRRDDDRHGRAVEPGQRPSSCEPALGGGVQHRAERRGEQRQQRLGLGVAEAGVELHDPDAARVSARPAYSSPANGVPRRAISSTVGCSTRSVTSATRPSGRPRQRRVGAHAAGVRPASPSSARLKSCAGSSGYHGRAVGDREQRHLGAVEVLLDRPPARTPAAWASASSPVRR